MQEKTHAQQVYQSLSHKYKSAFTGTWELEYNLKLEFLVLVHVLVQAFRKPGADESSSELKWQKGSSQIHKHKE